MSVEVFAFHIDSSQRRGSNYLYLQEARTEEFTIERGGDRAEQRTKLSISVLSVLEMKYPSSSSWKYDIFISFKGEETGDSFTGNLYSAFRRNGIYAFKDDTRLEEGQPGKPDLLLKAIEQSRISVVVFSQDYASSTCCLDQLVKIDEAICKPGRFVVPVFLDVDPSDVRKQSGRYEELFYEHATDFPHKVQKWKLALTRVASLCGYDVSAKSESDVIDDIVQDAIRKLGRRFSSLTVDLVGMQPRALAFQNLLELDSEAVRTVGIWGIGGVGKTTLATCVYDSISPRFHAACLLLDVSRVHKCHGLVRLQEQLLLDLEVPEDHRGTDLISTRLRSRKVLIVLDGVDSVDQVEALAGNPTWFGPGSRIIITTRDRHILKPDDVPYELTPLNKSESDRLFYRKAFKPPHGAPSSGFEMMPQCLLPYAAELPLTLTVLASSMRGLQEPSDWMFLFERLKGYPSSQVVMGVLKESFLLRKKMERDIFLDIACFFTGADVDYVTQVLQHCGFDNPDAKIRELRDRSLLNIVNGKLWMHDLLQDMGRQIVKKGFPNEPAKWTRLWSYQDIQTVTTGTKNTEAIALSPGDLKETPLKAKALSQMSGLRLLKFPHNVRVSGKLNDLSNKLRLLSWHGFPFSSLPSSFEPDSLVELIMPDSKLTQLWEGEKRLPNLRVIDLRGSKCLIKTPNVKGVENLERLDLEGCTGLLQVHPSVAGLRRIKTLNLRNCDSLISIPKTLCLSTSLEMLDVSGCSGLAKQLNSKGPQSIRTR